MTLLRQRFTGARLEFFRVAEVQERGVIHYHVAVRGASFLPVEQLQKMATAAGFGYVWVTAPRKVAYPARYMAKYLLKDVEKLPAGIRVWSCSAGWKVRWRPLVPSGCRLVGVFASESDARLAVLKRVAPLTPWLGVKRGACNTGEGRGP
jgi:hypothetical protein